MQSIELPLYPRTELRKNLALSSNVISDNPSISNPKTSIENALKAIFPEQSEENKVMRTRKMLGKTAQTLSNEQIETINTEFQFLIDTWLNEYEKELFSGLTLKEVLNET